MGRLSGFSYKDVRQKLRTLGFFFARHAKGCHEIWACADGRITVLPRHPGDIPEGTLRVILREASIEVDEFLNA
jgi:predicted RNA binding protein YcfA (HicA-like mRNA interferase family)